MNYLIIALNADDTVDIRPCAFDDVGERILYDDFTSSEYDCEVGNELVFTRAAIEETGSPALNY